MIKISALKLFICSCAIAAVSVWQVSAQQKPEKPNIIWLMAEDIAADIGCYGTKGAETPNLDQLAAEGVRYDSVYCTNPICSPSRSAMMVGVHQQKINAHHHRGNREVPLAEPYRPFTYWLRKAGYTTLLGHPGVMNRGRKIDCNFKFTDLGDWDGREHFGLFDRYGEFTAADRPFFAQIQLQVTHRGDWWDEIREKSPDPVDPAEVELPPYMADHPVIRADWARYLDQIAYMDREVGLLIEELREKGLYESTVIIFMGENGRCNIRGKGYLTDPGLHVPLIVSWPGQLGPGKVETKLISSIDVTATILDIAGLDIPEYMDGRSFLRGNFHRDHVYSSRDRWDDALDKSRSLTTTRYKYIRNDMPEVPYDAYHPYLEFHRPTLHIMRKLKIDNALSAEEELFFRQIKPEEELYDLAGDPHELVNLAARPGYTRVLDEMRATLKQEEAYNMSEEAIYQAQPSKSANIIKYVMYRFPEAYLRMLQGELIGYQKYVKRYNRQIEKK